MRSLMLSFHFSLSLKAIVQLESSLRRKSFLLESKVMLIDIWVGVFIYREYTEVANFTILQTLRLRFISNDVERLIKVRVSVCVELLQCVLLKFLVTVKSFDTVIHLVLAKGLVNDVVAQLRLFLAHLEGSLKSLLGTIRMSHWGPQMTGSMIYRTYFRMLC